MTGESRRELCDVGSCRALGGLELLVLHSDSKTILCGSPVATCGNHVLGAGRLFT